MLQNIMEYEHESTKAKEEHPFSKFLGIGLKCQLLRTAVNEIMIAKKIINLCQEMKPEEEEG